MPGGVLLERLVGVLHRGQAPVRHTLARGTVLPRTPRGHTQLPPAAPPLVPMALALHNQVDSQEWLQVLVVLLALLAPEALMGLGVLQASADTGRQMTL